MLPFAPTLPTDNSPVQLNALFMADQRIIGEKILDLLRAGHCSYELPESEAYHFYQIMLTLQPQDINSPLIYFTPPYADGSILKVDYSHSEKVRVSVIMGEATLTSAQFTYFHEAWHMFRIIPLHREEFRAWQAWCCDPLSSGESRREAVIKVMHCIRKHSNELNLSRLNLSSVPAPFPEWLTKIRLSHNKLTELPPLPRGLISLNLDDNVFSTLPSLTHTKLEFLTLKDNNISLLPDLPHTLEILLASRNNLHILQRLPDSIKNLNLDGNKLVEINRLPASVDLFSATDNQLTHITELPGALRSLFLARNKLTQLPELPLTLGELDVNSNQIFDLKTLPVALQILDAEDNQLERLGTLPGTLRYLNVRYNKITALPDLPEGLEKLLVRGNRLHTLPNLNQKMYYIDASLNQLAHLPALPPGLRQLKINNNRLMRIPTLPQGIYRVDARINDLEYLPDIPEGMKEFAVSDNPRLMHLLNRRWVAIESRERMSLYTLLENDVWNRMSKDANFTYFQTFLFNLSHETCTQDAVYRQHVGLWLADLANDQQLRSLTFAAAALPRDRVTHTWCTMQNIHYLYKQETQLFASDPASFLAAARQIYRVQLLEAVVAKKIRHLGERVDMLGFYLNYFRLLQTALELPSFLEPGVEPSFLPTVTTGDLKAVQQTMKIEETSRFHNWMAGWHFCQRYLQQRMTQVEKNNLLCRYTAIKQRMENQIRMSPGEHSLPERQQRAIARTDVAIYGVLVEKTFFGSF